MKTKLLMEDRARLRDIAREVREAAAGAPYPPRIKTFMVSSEPNGEDAAWIITCALSIVSTTKDPDARAAVMRRYMGVIARAAALLALCGRGDIRKLCDMACAAHEWLLRDQRRRHLKVVS